MSQITAVAKCTFESPEYAEKAKSIFEIIYDPLPESRERVSAIAIHSDRVNDILGKLFYIVSNPEIGEDGNSIFITIKYAVREDDLEILDYISEISRFIDPAKIFFLSFNDQVGEWSISSNYSGSSEYIYGTADAPNSIRDRMYAFDLSYKSLTDCIELYDNSFFSEENIKHADEEAETKAREVNSMLQVGVTVRHKTFGVGKILGFEGEGRCHCVEVDFENQGRKLLLTVYANLTVEN